MNNEWATAIQVNSSHFRTFVKQSRIRKTAGLWQIPPAPRPGHRDTDECLYSGRVEAPVKHPTRAGSPTKNDQWPLRAPKTTLPGFTQYRLQEQSCMAKCRFYAFPSTENPSFRGHASCRRIHPRVWCSCDEQLTGKHISQVVSRQIQRAHFAVIPSICNACTVSVSGC